jgi:hypothetical protein
MLNRACILSLNPSEAMSPVLAQPRRRLPSWENRFIAIYASWPCRSRGNSQDRKEGNRNTWMEEKSDERGSSELLLANPLRRRPSFPSLKPCQIWSTLYDKRTFHAEMGVPCLCRRPQSTNWLYHCPAIFFSQYQILLLLLHVRVAGEPRDLNHVIQLISLQDIHALAEYLLSDRRGYAHVIRSTCMQDWIK